MSYQKQALITLFAYVLSCPASAIELVGVVSCGSFVERRPNRDLAVRDEAWLVGYLSGLADGLNKDFLPGTDSPALFLWTENYCRANPLEGMHKAGQELAKVLMKRRGIKWP